MTEPMLQATDSGLQLAISSLEGQITQMIQAGNEAERINEEVQAHFIADSSSVFQAKVQDWVDNYKNVMHKFEQLASSLGSVKQVLTQAEEDAQTEGGNWGASDGIYAGLSG